MSSKCGKCEDTLDRRKSSSVTCSGFCNNSFHANCCGISNDSLPCLKSPGFCWYCAECFKMKNKYELYMKNSFDEKLLKMISGFESMFSDLKQKILATAKDTFSEMSVANKDVSSKALKEKNSYANIVSSKSMIVVKPKNTSQTNAETKSDIVTNVSAAQLNLKVSKVKQIKDGGILISCDGSEGANNFKKVASEKLSAKYDISDVKKYTQK
ncbi:hypothetical protein WA026_023396 [Henosepilachna vigintioctopunctata]|uniref:PHD-type domain-containing protein n=1 Tax=Henosepilachna vigintioctopunctata TaxID=420089 RepID=A0AAW1U4V8_9CUCU